MKMVVDTNTDFLQCALETKSPLLTLDRGMKHVAKLLDITLVE